MQRVVRRWTRQEDERLKRQVRAFPQNLARCFMIVAEELDRTPLAVSNHWYTKVSKDPEFIGFFTASPVHIIKNRKNGQGVDIPRGFWGRFLRMIRNINFFPKDE